MSIYVGRVRAAAAAPEPSTPAADGSERVWRRHLRELIAGAVVALLSTVISLFGGDIREFLFPTKAAVSGVITLRTAGLEGAELQLDGRPVGKSGGSGKFLLAGVDDGKHRLTARAGGLYHGSVEFRVARASEDRSLDPLELRPPLSLGYTILKFENTDKAGVVSYDFVLWVTGDRPVLDRVRNVSYQLPDPLSDDPVAAGSASASYCYRQRGTLAYSSDASARQLEIATATVRLDDGAAFPIASGVNSAEVPECPVRKAKRVKVTPQRPVTQTPWTPPVSDPPAAPSPRVLGVEVLHRAECTGSGATPTIDFLLSAENATTYRASSSGTREGSMSGGSITVSMPLRCNGLRQTFTFTVAGDDGRWSEARTVSIKAENKVVVPSGVVVATT